MVCNCESESVVVIHLQEKFHHFFHYSQELKIRIILFCLLYISYLGIRKVKFCKLEDVVQNETELLLLETLLEVTVLLAKTAAIVVVCPALLPPPLLTEPIP